METSDAGSGCLRPTSTDFWGLNSADAGLADSGSNSGAGGGCLAPLGSDAGSDNGCPSGSSTASCVPCATPASGIQARGHSTAVWSWFARAKGAPLAGPEP